MNKLTNDQIRLLLEAGYETRTREYKPSFSWNNNEKSIWIKEKVTQAVLAMSNTRYGGQIVIGVIEGDGKRLVLSGLNKDEFNTFEDYDGIKGYIDGFSYTDSIFDISYGEHLSKMFVVLTIQEFNEIPLICKKNGQTGVLRKDDIYVRSKKAPYSSIRATEPELREVIHMVVDKEKSDLISRNWIKKGVVNPDQFYKDQIKDLK
jgi:hypothetical protein